MGISKNPTHGLMYTTNLYNRYIFHFDYKWGNNQADNFDKYQYNAGCYFHGTDDEWNHCEIIVMGKEYAIFKLNGKIVNLVTDLPVADGIIGLQSETAEIYYRNIGIKEFGESVPLENFLE